MPISLVTAELAMSIVNGVIKLGGRIDKILAEQEAGGAKLALPIQATTRRTPVAKLLRDLSDLLQEDSEGRMSLGIDRDRIHEIVVGEQDPNQSEVEAFIVKYRPEALRLEVRNDNKDVEDELRRLSTAWDFGDEDICRLALYVDSGRDLREGSLEWRLAMAVLDVLAEFALEQKELLVRDEAGRQILAAVLQRFSEGDLEEGATTAKLLLMRVVSATLNGFLDTHEAWEGDNEWVEALLDAIANARAQAQVPDEFLLGLVQGRGYRLLVVELLEEGGKHLDRDEANAYQRIIGDMLEEAAKRAAESTSGFEDFFKDSWTDIARAGLRSVGKYGPMILDDTNPILRTALLAAVSSLAEPGNRDILSSDAFISATEAAIAAVAEKPELFDEDPRWANVFYGAFAGVVRAEGLRETFSVEGLEVLLKRTAAAAADHPELIVTKPGLAREVTGSILIKISEAKDLRSGTLATAAVEGAFTAIEKNPKLLETRYAEIFSDFAGGLALRVHDRSLSGIHAKDLAEVAAEAIAENPDLFADGGDPSWLQTAYGAFAEVLADRDLKQTFTEKGLEDIVKRTMFTVSENPELLIKDRGLARTVVANVLKKLAGTPDIRVETLATASIDGALTAIRDNPGLLGTHYAEVVGDLAGRLAERVRAGSLTGLQAQDLISAITETVAANPKLLANVESRLADALVEAVLAKAEGDTHKMLAGLGLVQVVRSVLSVVGARGENLISDPGAQRLANEIGKVIEAGLITASRELGHRLDLPSGPTALAALIEAWARGEISVANAEDETFNNAFGKLADWARRSRELPAPRVNA
jgi:hypothetical protein